MLLHQPDVLLFTIVLSFVFPVADHFFYSRLNSTIAVYLWNILAVWTLSLVAIFLIFRHGLTLSAFGLTLGAYPRTLYVSVILLALIAALALLQKFQKRKTSPEKLAQLTDSVHKLLPVKGSERRLFVLVAVTAGLCEEFLYRGWLLNLTGQALHSLWAGLLISSLLFGFAHLYQGRRGMFGTAVLGAFFGLVYLTSHSLLPGQLLHTFLDLNNGLALAKRASRSTP